MEQQQACGKDEERHILQQLARLDPGEMAPLRIHQELLAVGRDREAEMIGDRLMPAVQGGQPEGRGKIDPELPFTNDCNRERQFELVSSDAPRRRLAGGVRC